MAQGRGPFSEGLHLFSSFSAGTYEMQPGGLGSRGGANGKAKEWS